MQSIRLIEKDFYKKLLILFFVVAYTLFIMPYQLNAALPIFDKTSGWMIPDLSQYSPFPLVSPNVYCAPTAATNALWAFYQHGDNTLIQPGATDIDKADETIKKLTEAAYMNTDPLNGTLTSNMVSGLQGYADDFGTTKYTVSLLTAFNTGQGGVPGDGETLWNAMMDVLYKCEEVLVIISFTGLAPVTNDDVEFLPLDYEDGNIAPNGHAVTMTGYDNTIAINPVININDSDNNPTHNWPPIVPDPYTLTVTQGLTYLEINNGPYTGFWVIGAVAISTVPDSDGGGCFIATAANGSPSEPNANILRDFLNRFVLNN